MREEGANRPVGISVALHSAFFFFFFFFSLPISFCSSFLAIVFVSPLPSGVASFRRFATLLKMVHATDFYALDAGHIDALHGSTHEIPEHKEWDETPPESPRPLTPQSSSVCWWLCATVCVDREVGQRAQM